MAEAKAGRFELRLDPQFLEEIDNWRSKQVDFPSRSEAIRRLVEIGLRQGRTFTAGERLAACLLAEIHQAMVEEKGGTINSKLIRSALGQGHDWALRWEMPDLVQRGEFEDRDVREVCDVLDMWSLIQESIDRLSEEDRQKLHKKEPVYEKGIFLGYDGNGESRLLSIVRFLREEMGRFTWVRTVPDMNSHMPIRNRYRKMLEVFEPIRVTLVGRLMTVDELVRVLSVR